MDIKQWLTATKAGEIMVTDVVTLGANNPLAKAAEILLMEQISGAPVVDDSNKCLGVLAVSDLIQAEGQVMAEQQQLADSSYFNSSLALPSSVYTERLEQVRDKLLPVSQQPVERFMTTSLVSISSETPLATVVQNIIDAHVHRVLVVDEDGHLKGIISTTDVLAALLRAA